MSAKKKQKLKLKIRTKNKSYPLKDSPFYKLSSKRKLSEILNCSISELSNLSQDNGNYKVFSQTSSSGKSRLIQQPYGKLEIVHTRIASLLSRISLPKYLHSGRKTYSHVTNARQHIGRKKLLTTDIKSFFPSTKYEMVFKLYFHTFQMPGDIADLLTNICCYSNHVPTGSRLSMPIAFWANNKMFNEMAALSEKHDVTMTLYVDDVTFSGPGVNKLFLNTVRKIIDKFGHLAHPNKTKLFFSDMTKVVTGVVINGNQLEITNEQHLKIHEDFTLLNAVKDLPVAPPSLETRLIGRLHAMSQIDPKYKDKASSLSQQLKEYQK